MFFFFINEARLVLTKDITDVDTFACTITAPYCKNSPYSFIYSTSYWLGSPRSSHYVYYVDDTGKFYNLHCIYKTILGVRTVIVISKDYFL